MSNKITVNINDVYRMLKEGKTRKEIADHYGVKMSEAKKTFLSHPKILGVKSAKTYDHIEVIDPEEENAEAVNAENQKEDDQENTGFEPDVNEEKDETESVDLDWKE